MRVLLISHNIVRGDGQGRVNLELARHCLAEGHQVTLIADRADASLIEQGVTWLPIHPLLKRPDLVKTPLFAFRANGVVRRVRHAFDLIVGNGYVLTEKHHVSLCQFVHGAQGNTAREQLSLLRPRSWYRSAYTGFNAIQEKKSYESASVIVACSHAVQQELIAIGVPQDRIRVIHNGVDTEEFRPGPADAAALGLPPTRPLALFVGDIRSGRKNLDAVLRALPSVQNLELVVVGALPGSPYPAMARRLGIDKRVTFLGYRSDVANIMRACDFLVFPTRYEPFGLVVLEALSSGLPVIVTRAAGAVEVMNPECGELLDDPDDVASLSRAMNRLADTELRNRMSKATRAAACGHGWQRMAEEYLALFRGVGASR